MFKYKSKVQITNTLVDLAEPIFNKSFDANKEYFERKLKRELTETDREYFFSNSVIDLIKSIGKYFIDTDTIVGTPILKLRATGFVVDMQINRDGNVVSFNTEAIMAGGYNIQCLHYRYISHTALQCLVKNHAYEYIKECQKKEKKISDIEYSINSYTKQIEELKKEIIEKNNNTFEKQHIITKTRFPFEKTRFYTLLNGFEEYKKSMNAETVRQLEFESSQVKSCEIDIKTYTKEITKLTKKLELIKNSENFS